jgi:hypothetical protein
LQRALLDQQNIFKFRVNENLAAVRASFHVAKLIAQEGRPFTDEEFVKRCFMSMTEELFPEKKRCVSDVSRSARTVTRRIDDTGDFILSCLKNKCQSFIKFSSALDKSTDTCDTAQLLIFVRGIDAEFEITEKLAELQSLKGTTTGEDTFKKLCETLKNLHLNWKELCCVTTDGAKSMAGSNSGVVTRINTEMECSLEFQSSHAITLHHTPANIMHRSYEYRICYVLLLCQLQISTEDLHSTIDNFSSFY